MPGPNEPLGEDDKRAYHDGQANGRGRVADVVSRAEQQNQDNIAQPT